MSRNSLLPWNHTSLPQFVDALVHAASETFLPPVRKTPDPDGGNDPFLSALEHTYLCSDSADEIVAVTDLDEAALATFKEVARQFRDEGLVLKAAKVKGDEELTAEFARLACCYAVGKKSMERVQESVTASAEPTQMLTQTQETVTAGRLELDSEPSVQDCLEIFRKAAWELNHNDPLQKRFLKVAKVDDTRIAAYQSRTDEWLSEWESQGKLIEKITVRKNAGATTSDLDTSAE